MFKTGKAGAERSVSVIQVSSLFRVSRSVLRISRLRPAICVHLRSSAAFELTIDE
jgi:hypothetical protein